MKTKQWRRRHPPCKPQHDDDGALGTWLDPGFALGWAGPVSPGKEQPSSQLVPVSLGSAEQEPGNVIKGRVPVAGEVGVVEWVVCSCSCVTQEKAALQAGKDLG